MISAKDLTRTFEVGGGLFVRRKQICAVDSVSFSIGEGDTVALVGESGCGKSTLGRLMIGLLKPTSGQVLYEGRDIWSMNKDEMKAFRRNSQIVHQNPYDTLNPVRTLEQSLSAPLLHYKITGRKDVKKKVSELLSMVGLLPPEHFLDRYSARLSGGQMQRAAIARAVSINPKFIVADEAISMLDASLRIALLDILLELKRRQEMSCLFITHDFSTTRYFAMGGRVIVMYLGSIVEMGEMEEVLQKPLHPYTKMLISSVPIPDPKLTRQRKIPPLRSLDVPSLTEVPSGCKFRTRCPYAESVCTEKPEMTKIKRRLVACHLY